MAEQKGSRELVVALFPGAAADVPLTLLLVVYLEEHAADEVHRNYSHGDSADAHCGDDEEKLVNVKVVLKSSMFSY